MRTLQGGSFQSPSRGGHLCGSPSPGRPYPSPQFQSPSRGGHLCGHWKVAAGNPLGGFQSPSRGGHLCGEVLLWATSHNPRFQSPSRGGHLCGLPRQFGMRWLPWSFSPLHEGDTSVAAKLAVLVNVAASFSPLHEGDTSVALAEVVEVAAHAVFQSPSRGGHLCGALVLADSEAHVDVSVPFTRGTPLWLSVATGGGFAVPGFSPLHEGDTSVANGASGAGVFVCTMFQSPSRGGHLCGDAKPRPTVAQILVSVPFTRGTPLWRCLALSTWTPDTGFSPLHEGDTSVAMISGGRATVHHLVSVPFTRGTPLWPPGQRSLRSHPTWFQSPSRGGHLCGQAGIG